MCVCASVCVCVCVRVYVCVCVYVCVHARALIVRAPWCLSIRIIDPLASRCAKFRFKPLSDVAIEARLRHIIAAEQSTISNEARARPGVALLAPHAVCGGGGGVRVCVCVWGGGHYAAVYQAVEALRKISGGDLRKAINVLQSGHQLFGAELTPERIADAAGTLPPAATEPFWAAVRGRSFDGVRAAVEELRAGGYGIGGVLDRVCAAAECSPLPIP